MAGLHHSSSSITYVPKQPAFCTITHQHYPVHHYHCTSCTTSLHQLCLSTASYQFLYNQNHRFHFLASLLLTHTTHIFKQVHHLARISHILTLCTSYNAIHTCIQQPLYTHLHPTAYVNNAILYQKLSSKSQKMFLFQHCHNKDYTRTRSSFLWRESILHIIHHCRLCNTALLSVTSIHSVRCVLISF